MTVSIIATFAILAVLGWIISMPNRLQRLTKQSIEEQDIKLLVSEIERHPEDLRVRSFDKALTHLWNAKAYALAAQCLQHLLEHNPLCTKGHKWLKRMLEEQPQMVHKELVPELIEKYDPGIAAQCDSGG